MIGLWYWSLIDIYLILKYDVEFKMGEVLIKIFMEFCFGFIVYYFGGNLLDYGFVLIGFGVYVQLFK